MQNDPLQPEFVFPQFANL